MTGINSEANLSQDVLFSNTFGAALTAQLLACQRLLPL
nr:5'/3'-nucleotidase SurE [Psychrobacter faecalis]